MPASISSSKLKDPTVHDIEVILGFLNPRLTVTVKIILLFKICKKS